MDLPSQRFMDCKMIPLKQSIIQLVQKNYLYLIFIHQHYITIYPHYLLIKLLEIIILNYLIPSLHLIHALILLNYLIPSLHLIHVIITINYLFL